jgi:hypothetical protein
MYYTETVDVIAFVCLRLQNAAVNLTASRLIGKEFNFYLTPCVCGFYMFVRKNGKKQVMDRCAQ